MSQPRAAGSSRLKSLARGPAEEARAARERNAREHRKLFIFLYSHDCPAVGIDVRPALFCYFAAIHRLEVLQVDNAAEVPGRVAGVAGALAEFARVVAQEVTAGRPRAGAASADSGARLISFCRGGA